MLIAIIARAFEEIKDYTVRYEDQRKIVDVLGDAAIAPENQGHRDLRQRCEERLDATRIRETNTCNNLSNC